MAQPEVDNDTPMGTTIVLTDLEIVRKIRAISPAAADPFYILLEGVPYDEGKCKAVQEYLDQFTAFADWKVIKCNELEEDKSTDGSFFSWEIELGDRVKDNEMIQTAMDLIDDLRLEVITDSVGYTEVDLPSFLADDTTRRDLPPVRYLAEDIRWQAADTIAALLASR